MSPTIVIMRFLQLRWFLLQCLPVLHLVELPIKVAARVLFRLFGIPRLRLEDISFLEPERISERRYKAAKYAAMSFHILMYLGYVTWLPDVVLNSRGGAGPLAHIPESETFRAVGQWSSWLVLPGSCPSICQCQLPAAGVVSPRQVGPRPDRNHGFMVAAPSTQDPLLSGPGMASRRVGRDERVVEASGKPSNRLSEGHRAGRR